jgi:APA family basic amino acid/polyamine antiporter
MNQLFQRKPIAALVEDATGPNSLKRSLGAGDLIMLAIGAVIGAGIFGAIGTAAAGQIGPNGEVIRLGARPALVFSSCSSARPARSPGSATPSSPR